MKHQELYSEMSQILQNLVTNAKKLKELSQSKIVEEEFNALQEKQNELIQSLVNIDGKLQNDRHVKENFTTQHKKIEKQLKEFQKVNEELFERLRGRLSMIQFSYTQRPSSERENE